MLVERFRPPFNMPEADEHSADPRKDLKSQPSLLEALPGEIRNQIFEYCITHALKPTKITPWSTTTSANGIDLSVLPRWHGAVLVRMSGIGAIPLLFVNKGISMELGSLVYSKVDSLRIGGYILEHPNDDLASPSSNWNLIYPILLNPHIGQFTRSIKLKLPSTRDDLHSRNDSLRGFSVTGFQSPPRQQRLPNLKAITAVIPGLVECLKGFGRLESLEITITVEMTNPPDFESLYPLYDLCGNRTTVVFIDPTCYFGIDVRNIWWQWTEKWDKSWNDCLARHRRVEVG